VLSDWLWYTLLLLIAYTALLVEGILLPISAVLTLFIIAAVTILLLFMGIRNAWDIVTYMSIERSKPQDKPGLVQTGTGLLPHAQVRWGSAEWKDPTP
jgi:hypothetical protein